MTPYPELQLPKGDLGPLSRRRQTESVAEAIAFPVGTRGAQAFTRLIGVRGYEVGVRKPGKEADWEPPRTNPNDMLPTIRFNGEVIEYAPGFTAIFEVLQDLGVGRNTLALELIGCLLFRSAFMLDHEEMEPACWRYVPPASVVADIEKWTPTAADLPIQVFLHLIEALALNEDVKYKTLNYDIQKGYGRRNNLATCAHIVAVFLGRASLVKFAGSLARPPSGVAPITRVGAEAAFPLLAGRTSV
jgi:hypothetical protein